MGAVGEIREFIIGLRDAAEDNVYATWGQLVAFTGSVQTVAVTILMEDDRPGEEKKAIALDAVAQMFDAIAPMIPLPIFLQPFRTLIMWVARKIILALADGGIEAVYERLKAEAAE